MTSARQLPPHPRLKVRKVLKQARSLEYVLLPFLNQELTSGAIEEILVALCESLQLSPVRHITSALSTTLIQYLGRLVDREFVTHLSIRLASRSHLLEQGGIVPLWNPAGSKSYVLFKVIDMTRQVAPLPRYNEVVRSYEGPSAGHLLTFNISSNFAKYQLYLSGQKRDTFKHAEDLHGMWLAGVLKLNNGKPFPEDLWAPESLKRLNRQLLEGRAGICTGPLKEKLTKCIPCYLGQNACSLARRSRSLEYGPCRHRGKPHSGFLERSGYCTNCTLNGRFEIRENQQNGRSA